MKPETIRVIDIWVGRVICLVLTVIRRLRDTRGPASRHNRPPEKILFIKLIEQGATVLAAGAIQRACRMVGKDNVYFCVFEENREILDILDLLPRQNIFAIRHRRFTIFIWDILRLLLAVRRLRIDATVDMEFFARASAILAFLSGARIRVGLHRFTAEAPYRGDLMTHRVQYNPYLHTALAYDLLVQALASPPDDMPLLKVDIRDLAAEIPVFSPTAQEEEKVRLLLANAFGGAYPSGPLVLLNPNASDMLPLRKWPTERFVALGRMILRDFPTVRIGITGAPAERAAAEDLCRDIGSARVASLAGKTTLRELLVLYSMAQVLVTNDSGPGHFASLTPIHSIVMFGPETPALFGAVGGRTQILYAALACSPCVNVFNHRFSPCRNNRCMTAITVEQVYEAVAACLKQVRETP